MLLDYEVAHNYADASRIELNYFTKRREQQKGGVLHLSTFEGVTAPRISRKRRYFYGSYFRACLRRTQTGS